MAYNIKTSIGRWISESATLMQRSLVSLFRNDGYHITQEQWIILVNLIEEEGISQSELACKIDRDTSTVTRVIDTMVKNDLVTRKSNEVDRRGNCLHPTHRGRELHCKLSEIAAINVDKALQEVSEEDLKTTIETLKKISKNLK